MNKEALWMVDDKVKYIRSTDMCRLYNDLTPCEWELWHMLKQADVTLPHYDSLIMQLFK